LASKYAEEEDEIMIYRRARISEGEPYIILLMQSFVTAAADSS
jgi:hypothetical protein